MNQSISVQKWHQSALEVNILPVRIKLSGYSMNPLIRGYRDYVTVVPLESIPSKGDIVLFCEPGTNRYVMHRVWEVKDGEVLTWGDSCQIPDGWIPLESVWGKIVLIERGKRRIHPEPKKGLRWARCWHKVRPGYKFYERIKQGIARRIKKRKV